MSDADDRFEIIAALDRYAECLDTRNWDGLADVFAPDVEMDFEIWQASDLEQVKARIRSFLGGCGPSQHLLGNYRIDLAGDRATSRCYCRVMHFGLAEYRNKSFETWIEYADEWVRGPMGWRSHKRKSEVQMQQGDPSILGPG